MKGSQIRLYKVLLICSPRIEFQEGLGLSVSVVGSRKTVWNYLYVIESNVENSKENPKSWKTDRQKSLDPDPMSQCNRGFNEYTFILK